MAAAARVRRTRGVFSALALPFVFALPHLVGREAVASSGARAAVAPTHAGSRGSATADSMAAVARDRAAADSFSIPLRRRIDNLNRGLERVEPLGLSAAVGVFRSDSARTRSTPRPPSLGATVGLFALREGFLFGYSAIGYSEDGAAVLGGLDVLNGVWSLVVPPKNDGRGRSRTYHTTMSLSIIALGVYMASLDDQNPPRGRVVLHHFVGMHVALLACEGIDGLFSPRHGRRPSAHAGRLPEDGTAQAATPAVAPRASPSASVPLEDSTSRLSRLEANSPACCLPLKEGRR